MKHRQKNQAFTLIELLVVIAIVGLLASSALAFMRPAEAKARDARRLSDMAQLQNALTIYYNTHGSWPENTDIDGECNGGWDSSSDGDFIPALRQDGLLTHDILDPSINNNNNNCGNYQYIHYDAGHYGCDPAKGSFYVLEVVDMESTPGFPGNGGPHYPGSQSLSCPGFTWDTWAEYVRFEFEK